MPIAEFIHLKARTHYSLGLSSLEPKELAQRAAELSMPAIGVCDFDNMFGALEFSKAAADYGVQPIIGCSLSVIHGKPQANTHIKSPRDRLHLLAKNEEGYSNLLKLVSRSFLHPAQEPAPVASEKMLHELSPGLICMTGSLGTQTARLLLENKEEQARQELLTLRDAFADRLYLEICRHNNQQENEIEERLLQLAYDLDIPLVATSDVRFMYLDMFEATDALLCISSSSFLGQAERERISQQWRFRNPEEMKALYSDLPEALHNTLVIAERCAVKSPSRSPILPGFPTHDGRDENEEFMFQAREGLKERLDIFVLPFCRDEEEKACRTKEYTERLDFELQVIARMNYAGYFLIVSDFITWAKDNGIPVGPGRGSGAGSIAAWALKITELDPIRFKLLFERFLNPDRVSMPDFDIDFCQDQRGRVISYVSEKYGYDRVAQIITFGKLQARAVLRDVGRVLQLPYGQVDRTCKLIPVNPANPVDLPQALDIEPLLRRAMDEDQDIARMVNLGLKLEGLNRHASTHAAGIVIGDRPLEELAPLYKDERSEMPVIQFNMKYAEEAGLVKFDFLGLKTLTVIAEAVRLANRHGGNLDITKIPLDDAPTFAILGRGDSVGVFQMESSGMRDTLKRMKPDTLEDIIALISLYRPGPMDNIPTYIARKHGLEKPEYPHPLLEPVLKETFGVIIYQEQVMEIAKVLAGYTLAEADLLRRAMGKKIKAEMEAQRAIFAGKASKQGIDKQNAADIFDLIAKFASYGFNKSHAAAYAMISYQTAYMKANHPVEFFVANLNYEISDTDKLSLFTMDARKLGITVLPPDINQSQPLFSISEQVTNNYTEAASRDGFGMERSDTAQRGGLGEYPPVKINNIPTLDSRVVYCGIRYGLSAVRNVSSKGMDEIVAERKANGVFKNIGDFAARLGTKTINQRGLEFLIKSGSFNCLEDNQKKLLENMEAILNHAEQHARDENNMQSSLFDMLSVPSQGGGAVELKLNDAVDFSRDEKLGLEFEAMGFYLNGHPLDDYAAILARQGFKTYAQFHPKLSENFTEVKAAGVILQSKFKTSKKGRFAFADISDTTGSYEAAIYDEFIIDSQRGLLLPGVSIAFDADAKQDEGGIRIIIKRIYPLADALAKAPQAGRQPQAPRRFTVKSSADIEKIKKDIASLSGQKIFLEIYTASGATAEVEITA